MGIRPLLQFPHPPKAGPVLLTFPFSPLVPLSYWALRGSIDSFLLVRYSCPLSAGVLHALLCLKVYSCCIRGERCTPHPPTPLPSCSPPVLYFNWWIMGTNIITLVWLKYTLKLSGSPRIYLKFLASPNHVNNISSYTSYTLTDLEALSQLFPWFGHVYHCRYNL